MEPDKKPEEKPEEKCSTCRFYKYPFVYDFNKEGRAVCRIDPPALIEAQFNSQWNLISGWPMVRADDWCGKFEWNNIFRPKVERPAPTPVPSGGITPQEQYDRIIDLSAKKK